MKNWISVLVFLSSFTTYAQVTFPAGTNLCESTPWKLVWYDEFDGTAINTDKWFTYLDNNNWDPGGVIVPPVSQESRTMDRGANFLDANVTVSNGTCKLTSKYQPNTWVNSYKLYSSGLIKARKNGTRFPMFFHKGKFEMKARVSKAVNVWAAYWLWTAGRVGGKSEIDMFEYMPTNNADENTYSLHGWARPGTSGETTVTGTFSYPNINAYHIYTCEWDDNYVRIYMDGSLKYEGSRYTLPSAPNTPIGCQPAAGTTYTEDVHKAFPFADEYMSLICSMDYRENPDHGMPDRVFEIDYIRVYQRTPQPELKDVCTTVTGPGSICLNVPTTYYASVGEGTFVDWTVGTNIQILATGTATNGQRYITLQATGNGSAWITANVQGLPYACPLSALKVNAGVQMPPAPVVTLFPTSLPNKKTIKFTFAAPPAGTTYNWETLKIFGNGPVTYGTNAGTSTHLLSEGEIAGYNTRATNSCGTSDDRFAEYQLQNGVLIPHEPLRPANPSDQVTGRNEDLIRISESGSAPLVNSSAALFPNPAQDQLYLDMKRPHEALQIKIVDLNGRTVYLSDYKKSDSAKISIDVLNFTSGMYYITITEENHEVLHHKFVKQ